MSERFDSLTPEEKLTAVSIDCTKHPKFAILSGLLVIGKRTVTDSIPTAATDGFNEWYSPHFINACNRKQLRYLRLHECGHKALGHCTPMYRKLVEKDRQGTNIAMDHVVNNWLEDMDPEFAFIERPTLFPPIIDRKYSGWSWLQVYHDIKKQGQGGSAGGGEASFDEHRIPEQDAQTAQEVQQQADRIKEALRQGKMLSDRLAARAGNTGSGGALPVDAIPRDTDWRPHLRQFLLSLAEGDDYSRYNPPNRRLRALDTLFPSHFSESMGPLVLAVDTSGSMNGVLPMVLGEVARICQQASPERVYLVWWDTRVAAVQEFTPSQYASIARAMRPEGGGGTTPDVVKQYLDEKKIEPAACIWLTDGEFYGDRVNAPKCPNLWGIVGDYPFTPPSGKVVRIYE